MFLKFSTLRSTKKSGFSLVEMLMTLSLLTVVSIPMVMMLHQQKLDADKSKSNTVANTLITKLFDAVDIKDINLIQDYTVGFSPAVSPDDTRRSVYCTIAGIPGNSDGTKCNAKALPLFDRSFSIDPNTNTVTATVNLYFSTSTGAPADYSMTRTYTPYESYHIYTNKNGTATTLDSEGTVWSREVLRTPTDGLDTSNLAAQTISNCSSATVSGTSPYFSNARIATASGGCTIDYYFSVLPQKRYAVKLYFNNASTSNYTPSVDICTLSNISISNDTCTNQVYPNLYNEKVSEQYPMSLEAKSNNMRQYDIASDGNRVLHVSVSASTTQPVKVTAVEVLPL